MQRRKFMAAATGLLGLSVFRWPHAPVPGRLEQGAAAADGRRLYRGADLAFGTTVAIQLLHHDESAARTALGEAFAHAHAIDRLMSVYREDSQVQILNRGGRLDAPHPHLLAVVEEALRLSALTGGAFDITVQPLWNVSHASQAPGERAASQALVGWRDVLAGGRAVSLRRPGMAITLNGIAQGYATDVAMTVLREHGVTDALVDIGEFSAGGRRSAERSWQVGIADPRDTTRNLHAVRLDGRALATSGDYATAFNRDFSRHHIVDPATGESPTELASASVAAPTAMLADGLSTALMVMGSERGMELVARLEGVDALFVGKDGGARWSAGFPLV
ncbi:FAD:protein FMN transferase [Noviherbaspirillum aerium]|uniref:FAD:protein FMN transferase n=1 Tax=Noviherbaspirillum aerium TaxID=2588497 RepID=UPI001CEF8359|nr:FAD:protein FMN transferase [Noviherbaspirillum aerium]